MRILLAALLVAAPAAAQAPASAPAAQAAAVLVEVLNPRAREAAALEQRIAAISRGDGFRQAFGRDPRFEAARNRDRAAFDRTLARAGGLLANATAPMQREMLNARRQLAAQEFARRMTPAELNAAVAFFRSPTGAKLLAQQPAVAAAVATGVERRFAARIQAAERAVAPRVRDELAKLVPQQ